VTDHVSRSSGFNAICGFHYIFLLPLCTGTDDHTSLSVQKLLIQQGRKKAVVVLQHMRGVGRMTKVVLKVLLPLGDINRSSLGLFLVLFCVLYASYSSFSHKI
jgi:hypothetical protein